MLFAACFLGSATSILGPNAFNAQQQQTMLSAFRDRHPSFGAGEQAPRPRMRMR